MYFVEIRSLAKKQLRLLALSRLKNTLIIMDGVCVFFPDKVKFCNNKIQNKETRNPLAMLEFIDVDGLHR
jgi:hypothetical protein